MYKRSLPKLAQKWLVIGAFIVIPLILLFTFTYLPFGEMVSYSFYKMKYIGEKTFVGLRNYKDLFARKDIFNALKLLLYYMGGSVVQLVIALLLATILIFKTKLGNFFKFFNFVNRKLFQQLRIYKTIA